MKALYTCEYCNFASTKLDKMKAHEAAHKDAEILANRINDLIAEYNSKHDDAFCIAKFTPNLTKKTAKPAPDKTAPAKPVSDKAAPEKPARKPTLSNDIPENCIHAHFPSVSELTKAVFSILEGGD